MTRQQILEQVKALAPREREELIADLRQLSGEDEVSPAQMAELERRIAAAERGEVTMIPGDRVMADLRKRFGQ